MSVSKTKSRNNMRRVAASQELKKSNKQVLGSYRYDRMCGRESYEHDISPTMNSNRFRFVPDDI